MKRIVLVFFALLSLAACNKAQSELQPGPQEQETLGCPYTNVTLTYLGDDIGEQTSDAYLIKLWSDMQSDEFGNLQGPGELVQILLNAYYNPAQELNYSFLKGKYSPMSNSGSFTPYSFVSGYQTSTPAPGERLTVYDGSIYVSKLDGEDNWDIKLDLILPEGSSFAFSYQVRIRNSE